MAQKTNEDYLDLKKLYMIVELLKKSNSCEILNIPQIPELNSIQSIDTKKLLFNQICIAVIEKYLKIETKSKVHQKLTLILKLLVSILNDESKNSPEILDQLKNWENEWNAKGLFDK